MRRCELLKYFCGDDGGAKCTRRYDDLGNRFEYKKRLPRTMTVPSAIASNPQESLRSSLTKAAQIMLVSFHFAYMGMLLFASKALASPIVVSPGGPSDIIITSVNTLNSSDQTGPSFHMDTATSLQVQLKNNLPGSTAMNAYIFGMQGTKFVFVNAQSQLYAPTNSGDGKNDRLLRISFLFLSVATDRPKPSLSLPGNALVEPSVTNPVDPNAAVNFGFAEFTTTTTQLFVNPSAVDMVGLPIGLNVTSPSGFQVVDGLNKDAVTQVCNNMKLVSQYNGNPSWGDMCVYNNGALVRVLSPASYLSVPGKSAAFNGLYESYRRGDNRGYSAPSSADILSCNTGPFSIQSGDNDVHKEIVAILCAAFQRGTILSGTTQPTGVGSFYNSAPFNYYAHNVHQNEGYGIGYTFQYDDVTEAGQVDVSGSLKITNPSLLVVTAGGWNA
ncbi:hypothetical protein MRB53_037298 [Persea americana]|nr:hypothetical protein MRB53_037298 [Persea americana]